MAPAWPSVVPTIHLSFSKPRFFKSDLPQSGTTTLTSFVPGCFALRSSYQPRGNLPCMNSAQVGLSADGQGFLNAVPASFAQCDGRFFSSAPVAQEVHELSIVNIVFNAQVRGFICTCLIHDVGWLSGAAEVASHAMTSPLTKRTAFISRDALLICP